MTAVPAMFAVHSEPVQQIRPERDTPTPASGLPIAPVVQAIVADRTCRSRTRRAAMGIGGTLAGGIAVSALGACAVGGAPQGGATLTKEPVTLTYWSWDESRPDLLPTLQGVLTAFTAKQTNIKVEAAPPSGAQFQEKLIAAVTSGTPPDVAATHFTQVRDLGPNGVVQDLSKYVKRDPFPKEHVGWEPYAWRAKQYGVPYGLQGSCIFYNRALFEGAGVPLPTESWTWEQFADAAKRLVKEPREDEDPARAVWGASDYGGRNFQYQHALLMTYGGGIVNEKLDEIVVASPASQQGLEFRASWAGQRRITSPALSAAAGNAQFFAGQLAMQISGSWLVSNVKASQLATGPWDVAPLPKGPKRRAGLVHAQGVSIPSGVKRMEEAWALIKHLSLPESLSPFGKVSYFLPANRKVWDSALPADGRPAGFKKAVVDTWEEIATNSPFLPRNTQVSQFWREEMDLVWMGQRPAREGAQGFKTKADGLIRDLKAQNLI